MIDHALAAPKHDTPIARPRAIETILYGGLAVGVLDGLAAVLSSFLLRRTSPIRVFQYIASGLIGGDSFKGGLGTFLLGVLLHFLIAFVLAATYYAASLRFPMLIRRAVISGLSYGVAVYGVMNYLVVPLSAVRQGPFSFPAFLQGLIVHALCVGLPIALIARRSSAV